MLQGHLWREVPQRKWAPVGVSLDFPAAAATPDGKGWRLGLNANLCNSMLQWGVGCRGRRRKRKWDGRRRLQFPIPVPKFSLVCMSESAFLAPRGTSFTSQVLGSEVHITPFPHGFWTQNGGPHACKTGALETKLSPRPQHPTPSPQVIAAVKIKLISPVKNLEI